MTRVIHTGDTHIGYQQYNAPERRQDFLEGFRSVVDDAIDDDVDAVVHAGDLFHDRRPSLLDLQGTVEILRTLADADIPFLAVVGNHESKRDAQWLDLFADLGLATRLGRDPQVIDNVAVYGLDFVPESRRDDLEYDFAPVPAEADHATLVSHGLFEPFAHANWDTEHVLETSSVEFDAVLLGDNHKPDTAEVADAWVTYCGSTERASASEREDRGYNLVDFDDSITISRRGLTDTREFVFVDVDLEEGEGVERVQERVRQHDLEDAVVIVTLEGDGKPVTPATIEEAAIERGALVARLNDRRDLPEEDEAVSVSFADPDAAVRERVRDLGLSDAARSIDETVRNDDLVDSNVRESVERRVRELLEDDASAFDPAPERSPDDEDVTTVADQLAGTPATAEPAGTDESASSASTPVEDGGLETAPKTGDLEETGETDETNDSDDSDDSDETENGAHAGETRESSADSTESTTDGSGDGDTTSLGDFA
ncbi:DNA double-strand break repair protein Mre11 [Natronorubrum daqingense]|uniref:DNA double-strand break repair protein Mre11 n=1 Tax=Natronorubrum daqingense TaxID=588898 RepID=A0A1N6Y417_9EURY|nr:DNA double-strand break repair protein Mre11 [Natronorubrum daqingense]APX95787.1 DNA repair exonuclease [Natronorubrum daqingense]SIR09283.1 DNA repair exonuclease SbcCD nuclease subunit [Natronorubrum daqingense]